MRFHPSVSMNNGIIFCNIGENKIGVCQKTAGYVVGRL